MDNFKRHLPFNLAITMISKLTCNNNFTDYYNPAGHWLAV